MYTSYNKTTKKRDNYAIIFKFIFPVRETKALLNEKKTYVYFTYRHLFRHIEE